MAIEPTHPTRPLHSSSFPVRGLAASGAAGALVLAAPPFDLWPLGLLGLAALAWAVHDRRPAAAAALAGWAGFTWFFLGCLWWPDTLQRFAHVPASIGWALAVVFAAYQGLPFAITAGLVRWLATRLGVWPVVSAPLLLILAEIALPFTFQAHLAIFAWSVPPLIQIAELGGAAAVSGWLLFLVLLPLDLVHQLRRGSLRVRQRRAVAILVFGLVAGLWRLDAVERARQGAPPLEVGWIQPNFGIVTVEDRRREGHRMIHRLRRAAERLERQRVDLVVLPESAWPFLFDTTQTREFPGGHPWHLPRQTGARLLFGALTHPFQGQTVWNSAVLVGRSGQIAGRYDKTRLVPLAEADSPRLAEMLGRLGGSRPERPLLRRGDGPRVLHDDGLPVAALICAEDLHPRLARDLVDDGARLLVAIANDAWFGDSAAPHQHFALAAFRAVETRRDLLRVANTGVSGLVDATGRVRARSTVVGAEGSPTAAVDHGSVRLVEGVGVGRWGQVVFPWVVLVGLVGLVRVDAAPRLRNSDSSILRQTPSQQASAPRDCDIIDRTESDLPTHLSHS